MTSDISKVDFQSKKNNGNHKTCEISTEQLIIRRGLKFSVKFHFAGKNIKPESWELTVQTGTEASEELGTKSIFGVNRKCVSKKPWHTRVAETATSSVTLEILSPADASIGKYSLSVKTSSNGKWLSAGNFVLLFNPWCEKDSVYMAEEVEKLEYVMNEEGVLFRGACNSIHPLGWDFGQFEDDILDICLKILDLNPKCKQKAAQDFSNRCDPIYVSRVISAMINSNDDDGVLLGNWSGNYCSGVSPCSWNGSVDILRKWKESNYQRVKYGQCWVFAGVMSTVLRCLGIPCRPITNFRSAHDTHGNLSIDECYDDKGAAMDSDDSIWNYHCWVEAWMKRPDLRADGQYDGWQVLDPTPQELSGGVYCCGPASLKAILDGHTDLTYDVPFVFAEVNADRVIWFVNCDGTKKRFCTETKSVGHNISTKSVGSDKRCDITNNYKYPEGSKKEREVFEEACKRAKELHKPKPTDEVEPLTPPPPKVSVCIKEGSLSMIGKDIDLVIRLFCPSPRKLKVHMNAQGMHYNGTRESDICCEKKKVELQAKKEMNIPFKIPFSKYGSHIQGNNTIKVSVIVHDMENAEVVYMADEDISPEDPPMNIIFSGVSQVLQRMQAEVNFDNPLSEDLTNCIITIEGSGLLMATAKATVERLGPDQILRVLIPFTPFRWGSKRLVADFDCDQFKNIKASRSISIKPYSSS